MVSILMYSWTRMFLNFAILTRLFASFSDIMCALARRRGMSAYVSTSLILLAARMWLPRIRFHLGVLKSPLYREFSFIPRIDYLRSACLNSGHKLSLCVVCQGIQTEPLEQNYRETFDPCRQESFQN